MFSRDEHIGSVRFGKRSVAILGPGELLQHDSMYVCVYLRMCVCVRGLTEELNMDIYVIT